MNGKDALLLACPNGTLVDVSDLEGAPLSLRDFLLLLMITLFFFHNSMEGVWEGFFIVCLFVPNSS